VLDDFGHVHLDPSRDLPERYGATLELFAEVWGRLEVFRGASDQDDVIGELVAHVQKQLIAAAVVLSVQADLQTREQE
jgi:hypothetical protein